MLHRLSLQNRCYIFFFFFEDSKSMCYYTIAQLMNTTVIQLE